MWDSKTFCIPEAKGLNQRSDKYFVKYIISKYLFSFLKGNYHHISTSTS